MSQELNVLGPFVPFGLSSVPTPTGENPSAKYFLFESEASEHRLDASALGYSRRDEFYQSKVGLGADGVFAAVNAEEEIFVSGNSVIWSAGGCVRKSFTLDRPIIQAMIVNFDLGPSKMDDSGDKPSYASDLCVLHSEGVRVFCADGRTFSVVSPVEMERMWPLPTGLLLQSARSQPNQTVTPLRGLPNQRKDEHTTTIYSLLHPLEAMQPVSFLNRTSSLCASLVPPPSPANKPSKGYTPKTPAPSSAIPPQQAKQIEDQESEDSPTDLFICSPSLRLIYSSMDVPLVVLYNIDTKLHSIWLIRKDSNTPTSSASSTRSPSPTTRPTGSDAYEAFQAGYRRDLSWGQEERVQIKERSDLRFEHLHTEVPRLPSENSTIVPHKWNGVEYEPSEPARQVFLLVTPDANLRLCFMLPEHRVLHLYEMVSPEVDEDVDGITMEQKTIKVARRRSMACLAAIPLRVLDPLVLRIANRNIRLSHSFLILDLNHNISLYSMNEKICDCTLPDGFQSLTDSHEPKHSNGTPLLHRTPSHGTNTASSIKRTLPASSHIPSRTPGAFVTPKAKHPPMRTPSVFSTRLIQSPLIFSPMTPGSPFPLDDSDIDVSLSIDLDQSINQMLLNSPLPASLAAFLPQASTTFETPAKPSSAQLSTPLERNPLDTRRNTSDNALISGSSSQKSSNPIVEILQPVSNRFSVLFEDGQIFRLSLKISPSSPLISDCLRAASTIMPSDACSLLLAEYIVWKNTLKTVGLGEWHSFSLFLQSLLPTTASAAIQNQSQSAAKSDKDELIGVDDDDWNFLLSSEYHASKSREPIFKSLPVPQQSISNNKNSSNLGLIAKSSSSIPTKLPSSSSQVSSSSGSSTTSSSERLKEFLKKICKPEHSERVMTTATTWQNRENVQLLNPFISRFMHALHLLCENYKLSVLDYESSKLLSAVLLEMATILGWHNYVDFYARTLDVSPVPIERQITGSDFSRVDPQMEVPPSIWAWMVNCLRGQRESFPVMREPTQPCELTRKLCRIYHILTFGPPSEPDEIEACFEPFSTLPISMGTGLHKTPRTSPIKIAKLRPEQRMRWNVRARLAVVAMDEEFADVNELDSLHYGIVLPLREAIHTSRHRPPTNWPLSCYRFIGREDLAMQGMSFQKVAKSRASLRDAATSKGPSTDPSSGTSSLSSLLNAPYHHPKPLDTADPAMAEGQTWDGMVLSSPATLMRFGKDERLAEVSRLLRSSNYMQLRMTEEISHQSDPEQLKSFNAQLVMLCTRQLALSLGRGMYTLCADLEHWGDAEVVGDVALEGNRTSVGSKISPSEVLKACARSELLDIPKLMTKARMPDSKALVSIDATGNTIDWPKFHNGAAAGLRLPPSSLEYISWQWIVSNRPKKDARNASHAGFLLSMGLLGHLKEIDMTGLYDYLSLVHPMTSASLLVGYGASVYGSRSSQLSKVLSIHLPDPSRITSSSAGSGGLGNFAFDIPAGGFEDIRPDNSYDFKVPELVQCASVIAAGLGFAETSHRHRVESLLRHISNPRTDISQPESFSLSCGIGLGFICLGQGRQALGLADLDILNRLCACMEGTKIRNAKSTSESVLVASKLASTARTPGGIIKALSHHPAFAMAPGASLSSANISSTATPGVQLNFGPVDLGLPPRKPSAPAHPSERVENPVLVKQGPGINKEVSAPGAALALGLIWLKTNDSIVADRLALPHATSDLATIRPDVQIQRVISRNLVMWDEIAASQSWMESQYPHGALQAGKSLLGPAALRDIVAEKEESFQLLKTAYIAATGGACMSVGIRMAGTADNAAVGLIKQHFASLSKLLKNLPDRLDKSFVEMALLQTVLAWSLVMAGTGDLELLRVLRTLRKRFGVDGKRIEGVYGFHMAISMAIGFLFLGGGRFSISTSNKAIAALVTSLYPIWPGNLADTRYHLPLMRHFYVLAVEPRCLEARDVDRLTPENVPIRVWMQSPSSEESSSKDHPVPTSASTIASKEAPFGLVKSQARVARPIRVLDLVTPCLLPPTSSILKLEVRSPIHWRSTFRPSLNPLHYRIVQDQHFLLVKRNSGSVSSSEIPQESSSGLWTSSHQFDLNPPTDYVDLGGDANDPSLTILNRNPTVAAYANFLLGCSSLAPNSNLASEDQVEEWEANHHDLETKRLLEECQAQDKESMLPCLLWLQRVTQQIIVSNDSHKFSTSDKVNIQLIRVFYDQGISETPQPENTSIPSANITKLNDLVSRHLLQSLSFADAWIADRV